MAVTSGGKETKAPKPRKKGYAAAVAAANKLTLEERGKLINEVRASIDNEISILQEKLEAARKAVSA